MHYFLAGGMLVGLLVAANRDESAPTSQYALAEPVPMPPLVLTDTAGLPFDLRERAAGRVTLLYLGYVNCPDVCPITTGVLSQTMASMPADVRATVQVVFVTVDPTRDSPDQIRSFLDQYAGDRNVPLATYWLGESLYQQKKYSDAANVFLDIYKQYPQSQRAPESLVRLGQSLAQLGNKEGACGSLGAVVSKYPKASANVKKSAADEQKRLGC